MPEEASGSSGRLEEPLAVFLGFMALGIAGMAPSVTFGDSGEFAASAAALALPHAPSYPLYVLLAKAAGTAAALGNWAYRTNLLSVICGSAALVVFGRAMRLGGMGPAGRLAAILVLGLSPLWRRETALTEVFALNSLCLAGLLWLACRYSGRLWGERPMAALGLVLGMGLGNHHTLVLAAPPLALEAWLQRPPGAPMARLLRSLALAAGFAALGLLVYAFLPLRAAATPPLDWGHPTTLERFLRVLLRKDYGSFSLTVEGPASSSLVSTIAAQTGRYLAFTGRGLGWPVLAMALAGAVLWRRGPASRGPSRWLPLSLAIMTGPFFLCLGNPPADPQTAGALERFYLSSWAGLAWLAGAGLERLLSLESAPLLLRGGLAAGLGLCPLAISWQARDEWWLRPDLAAYDYGRSLLKSLPRGAALFMDGGDDTFYTLAFLSYAEGRRPDLELRDRGGLVFKSAYGPDFRRIPKDLKEARRVEVEARAAAAGRLYYSTLRETIVPGYDLRPWGLLRRAETTTVPPTAPPSPAGGGRLRGRFAPRLTRLRDRFAPRLTRLRGASLRAATTATGDSPGLWEIYPQRAVKSLLRRHYRDRALVCLYPFMRAADLRLRGEGALALGFLGLAWDMGADVLWLPSNLAFALGMIGFEASKAAQWPLAEQAFLLARKAVPAEAEPLLNLGVVYEKTGRTLEAEAAYREALKKDPSSSRAHYNLGALYWSQARWGEAEAAFEKALELKPGDADISRFLALARQRGRRP